jgi:hypothetical protein
VFSGSGHVIGDSVPSGRGPTVGGGQTQINGQHGQPTQQQLEATAQTLEEVLDLVAADDPHLAALRAQIDVRLDDSGLLIQISDGGDEILFGLASSDLTPALAEFLAALGPVLGRLSNELQIHGHTDARPFPEGSSYDNWNLSFAPARTPPGATSRSTGVRPHQIVGVLAHADSDLLVPEDPLDPRNRRLSILAVRHGAERPAARGRVVAEGDPELPAAEAAREALEALRARAEQEGLAAEGGPADAEARSEGASPEGRHSPGPGSAEGHSAESGDAHSGGAESGSGESGSGESGNAESAGGHAGVESPDPEFASEEASPGGGRHERPAQERPARAAPEHEEP